MTGRFIPDSELIVLNGRVYHLNLKPEMVADTIIVVGDPERVPKVSMYFDKIELQVASRELVTHTGYLGGKRISVISSGMGTDNVELLMTELDALVNVDLETRTVKPVTRSLEVVRIGTSGCLQGDIPIDAQLVSVAALGLDTLMSFYQWSDMPEDEKESLKVQQQLGLPFKPYFARASARLVEKIGADMHEGITVTAPGFYGPQGRQVRLQPAIPGFVDQLASMSTPLGRFTNLEMETAGYYSLGRLLGHEMLSVNVLIANRATQKFSSDHDKAIDNLIRIVLDRIV